MYPSLAPTVSTIPRNVRYSPDIRTSSSTAPHVPLQLLPPQDHFAQVWCTVLSYQLRIDTISQILVGAANCKLQRSTEWQTLFRWPRRSALPNGARCSDDLAAAHYWLSHAVPMVGLLPWNDPNRSFYWDLNRLKAQTQLLIILDASGRLSVYLLYVTAQCHTFLFPISYFGHLW